MNNLRESYKYYKENAPEPVDIKTYLKIASQFITFLMGKVFEGSEVKLPARLGSFKIVGTKVKPRIGEDGEIKGLAPNWPETKKLWEKDPEAKARKQLVYCFNEHTNGIKYKLAWAKKNVNIKNKTVYSFKLSRANKRKIHELAKKGKEYIVYNI